MLHLRTGSGLRYYRKERFCLIAPMLIKGSSSLTASKAMPALVKMGMTSRLTGRRRNRVCVDDGYLNILNENSIR